MGNKIHYTAAARRDMDEIWEYIAQELQNPSAAENVVNGIMDAIDQLERFAGMGAPLSSIVSTEQDYRFLVSGSYLAFYRVQGQDVYIDRVLYGRRDYLRVLFEDSLSDAPTE